MRLRNFFITLTLVAAATLSLFLSLPVVHAQQASQNKQTPQDEDVLRIKTELVQTDLTVFDKQGRFVDGLRPEQFELSLDGKPQAISFFERVSAGSSMEAAQVAAARSDSAKSSEQSKGTTQGAANNGRVIFFFLDDLHLSEASLMRARKALGDFIDNQMQPGDQVAIVSASGQIGFLQQLTDYKPMLRAAINRLVYKKNPETYAGKVPISEYEANQVVDNRNRELFTYLVMATINEYQSQGPLLGVAVNMVRNRVRQIASQSKAVTINVLEVLESLMRSSAQLPGRKLVFFMSDGFIANTRGGNALPLLKRVTEIAAHSGVVVYTMDARGTFNDPTVDAGRNDFPDGMSSGTQARTPSLEAAAMQEPLHILAEDTGGRAIINDNSFADAFQQAIDETSAYYLLAWRPDTDDERNGKSKIKVTVKDRPDLRVRLRRSYYVPPPPAEAKAKSENEKSVAGDSSQVTPEEGLLTALGALYPQRTIPTALAVGYVNTLDQGLTLKASMQIDRAALDVATGEAKKSEVDVIGAAIDDRGIIVTFKQLLTIVPDSSTQNQAQPIVWNQQLKLQPGLYQVRVAVRERASGRTGSAQQWIEVPDLASGQFLLSSLFLGERKATPRDEKFAAAPQPVTVDVDHHFARASIMRFQAYIYNATHNGVAPNIEIQTRVLKGDRTIITMPSARVPTDTTKDLTRLPYWAEIALDQLPVGKYLLQVTATDRATKASATQQVSFVVE
ncbi:MAG TPA: VWA domain-containing protein [Pyrinomonadaceae bacterium]